MRLKIRNFVLAVFALALVAGCGSSITLVMPVPSVYNFGSSKQLVLAEMTGRRSIKEEAQSELSKLARGTNWWQYSDKLDKGITIKLLGDNAKSEPIAPVKGEVFIKVEIFEWNAERGSKMVNKSVKVGKDYITQKVRKTIYKGSAVIGITTVDAKGRAHIAEREYNGISTIDKSTGDLRQMAKVAALSNALGNFLKDITPTFVRQQVKLDDEAEDMKPTVELIVKGAYAEAASSLSSWMERAPARSDVVYNLAVVTEGMGDLKKAKTLYSKALTLGSKPFYSVSLANCANRISAKNALEK
ncbi:MAG: hypothetical protein KAT46_00930 [Deltaproteobacteria bacterium]|nr:hypothetical protein [Deltaproteobacteria bacterium]